MPINGSYSPYALERARKAIEYIHTHHRETLSPEQLAEEVKMDTKQLQSLVQFLTGHTIHSYKMNLRIDLARLELEDFSKAIKDIACKHGFGSASHFIREFRKRMGITPGQYRYQLSASINPLPG
jgi:AraC-like DNA-binding protein